MLIHDLPKSEEIILNPIVGERNISEDTDGEENDTADAIITESKPRTNWYTGNVYYSFKNMVIEVSIARRGVVELSMVLERPFGRNIPTYFYLEYRRVDYVSIQ